MPSTTTVGLLVVVYVSKQTRVVIIDSNEASMCPRIRELIEHRFTVVVRRLKSADYVLTKTGKMKGSIGIERKTIDDLIASVKDGRLWKQVSLLCDTYQYPILLIEGSMYPFTTDPILMGAYVSLILSFSKLKVAHSRDMRGSAAFIKRVATYFGPSGREPPLVKEKYLDPKQVKIAMLTTIQGIGPKRAKALLSELPELFHTKYRGKDMKKKLDKVKGLSRKARETILKVFLEE